MSYQINILGDSSGAGHVYIQVPSQDKSQQFIFGKYPDQNDLLGAADSLFDNAVIRIDDGRRQTALSSTLITEFSVQLTITDSQYNGLVSKISNSVGNSGNYTLMSNNCADWVSNLLKDSGIRANGLTDLINEGLLTNSDLDKAGWAGKYVEWIYAGGTSPGLPQIGTTGYQNPSNLPQSSQLYNLSHSNAITSIATSLGLTLSQLENIAGNTYLQDRHVTMPNGGFMYLWKSGDKLNYTPTDNDFDYVAPAVVAPWVNTIATTLDYAKTLRSPLVLDLNGNGIELKHVDNGVYFDIDKDGFAEKVGWVKGTDGMLAMDRNGNGIIDNITELYGDDTAGISAYGKLRLEDSNHDNSITSADTNFSNLRVWVDANEDGKTDAGELKTLTQLGITSISLTEQTENRYLFENYISTSSTFVQNGNTHTMADVHFLNDDMNSSFVGYGDLSKNITIDLETIFMPKSRGYGNLPALHIAMSNDPVLLQMVKDLDNLSLNNFSEVFVDVENILLQWSGVLNGDPLSRATGQGSFFDSRKADFLDKFTGQPFLQHNLTKMVDVESSAELNNSWNEIVAQMTGRLLVQGALASIFPHASYNFKTDTLTLGDNLNTILHNASNYVSTSGQGSYDFWTEMGQILVQHKSELGVSTGQIKTAVSSAAGQNIFVADGVLAITGDAGNNIINGTPGTDNIDGLAGNDTIYGGSGDDTIKGGDGNDTIHSGNGVDRIDGGSGDNIIYGDAGDDIIRNNEANSGNDHIYGGDGNDFIQGGSGADYIDGGAGHDIACYVGYTTKGVQVNLATGTAHGGDAEGDVLVSIEGLRGSNFNDTLIGDAGNNDFNGEAGDDFIDGAGGDDNIFGETGNDTLKGGDGNDWLDGFFGNDNIDGGAGIDWVNYSHPEGTQGVVVDLTLGTATDYHGDHDTLANIENVLGSKFDDSITGNSNDNFLVGGDGNDALIGMAGNDVIAGMKGNDIIDGGDGTDYADYSQSGAINGVMVDLAVGVAMDEYGDHDTLTNIEGVVGTKFADVIKGDAHDNLIIGGNGNNVLEGNGGNDNVFGGNDNDTINGGTGNDYLYGGGGDDTYIFNLGWGNDIISESTSAIVTIGGNDTISLGDGIFLSDLSAYRSSDNLIIYNKNNPFDKITIVGQYLSTDTKIENLHFFDGTTVAINSLQLTNNIYGGITITGTSGDDLLNGSNSNDFINGGAGNDIIYGSAGNDTLNGGDGFDSAWFASVGGTQGVTVDLAAGTAINDRGGNDILISIENISGTNFDDTITGDSRDNRLYGNSGDDILTGGEGDDSLDGSDGNDTYVFNQGWGQDTIFEYSGNDTISFGSGITLADLYAERVISYDGTYTNDLSIYRSNSTDKIIIQYYYSSAGNKVENIKFIDGTILTIDNAFFSNANQALAGNPSDNIIHGQNGNDQIHGYAGNDALYGSNGNDTLYGDDGDDILNGGAGTNILYGGAGNDIFKITKDPNSIFNTTIADFEVNNYNEKINLFGYGSTTYTSGITDISQINITASGNDSIITLTDGSIITVRNVSPELLTATRLGLTQASDTKINQVTLYNQQFPYIIILEDGRSLLTWSSKANGNSNDYSYNIIGKFLDKSGNPIGNDFTIESTFSDGGYSVAKSLQNGNIVITWNATNGEIYAKIISDTGVPVVNTFSVNTTTSGYQYHPSVAKIANDKFIVTWQSINPSYTSTAMTGQIFDINGNKIGSEILLNSIPSPDYINDITSLNNGDFILARNHYNLNSDNYSSYLQIYDSYGLKKGSETLILNSCNVSTISLTNGTFLALWTAMNHSSFAGVHGCIFDANNQPLGQEYMLEGLDKAQTINAILLKNGNIAVTWDQYDPITSGDVRLRIFNQNGYALSNIYSLNDFTPNNQNFPKITETPDGKIIATWISTTQDGDGNGIYSRVIDPNIPYLEVTKNNIELSYIEDAPIYINTINVSSNNDKVSATITLSDIAAGSIISDNFANVQSSYSSSTGTWSVSGNKDAVNTLLAGLKFTPAANYNGNIQITYTISDGQNQNVTGTINLNGMAVNDAPIVSSAAPNQDIVAGKVFSESLGANLFNDVDGDALTYSIKQTDGATAPAWLSFNPVTMALTGAAPIGFSGVLHIALTANDSHGGIATSNFDINIHAPVSITTASGSTIANNEFIYLNSSAISLQKLDQNLHTSPIIETPDGQTVFPDAISAQRMTLTNSAPVTVTFKNSVAGYSNSLGWYIVAEDGTIQSPQVLFKNAHAISEGTSFNLGNLAAGTQIGFFVAGNGGNGTWSSMGHASLTMDQLDLVNGTFKFVGANGNNASVYGNSAALIYTLNGIDYTFNQNVYHSSNNANLNPDHIVHSGAGWDAAHNNLLVGFEDLYGGGDLDYNDILFNVDLGAANNAVKYAGVPLLASGLAITAQAGVNITSASIGLNGAKAGDKLVFEGHNITNGIIDGTNAHITNTFTNGVLTLNLSGLSSNAEANTLLHSLKLVNAGDADSSGTRDINLTLHDSTGADTSAIFHVAVATNPINGTTADNTISSTAGNDNIYAHEGNDIINAGAGDDIIHGGLGADILTGGTGSDSFDYSFLNDSKTGAYDTITDFQQGIDHINLYGLTGAGIINFNDLNITHTATETIITANDNAHPGAADHFELHLQGIIDLQQADFMWG